MDTVEMSNLSRQFLFRSSDIGQPKAKVAATAASKMNPEVCFTSFLNKVASDTEHIFHAQLWESHDVIINALDNVEARKYVDSQCLFFKRPLFESGTLGSKCNSQVVIPYLTESYSSSNDAPDSSIPLCTLKNFPSSIEHTIQWARDAFHKLFNAVPNDVNAYLTDPRRFAQSLDNDMASKPVVLKDVKDALDMAPRHPHDCVLIARRKFDEFFGLQIRQLLHNIPLDRRDEHGNLFWTGAKRPPTPLSFDPRNDAHAGFVYHTSRLLSRVYGVADFDAAVPSADHAAKLAARCPEPPFEPKAVLYTTSEKDNTDRAQGQLAGDIRLEDLPPPSGFSDAFCLHPQEFEKDDDRNSQIDFIAAVANLRATNYAIPTVARSKVKQIAGRIIPAMVTATSFVTGLVCLEIMKYALGANKLSHYRNSTSNLAINSMTLAEPIGAPSRTYFTESGATIVWTLWDRLDVDEGRDLSVKELVDVIRRRFEVELFMMTLPSGKIIFSQFGMKKADFNRAVSDVARDRGAMVDEGGIHHLCFVGTGTVNGVDADVPLIRYRFRGF
jgi:ubiquitin-activating enzyme E1